MEVEQGISPKGKPHPTRYHLDDERRGKTVHFKIIQGGEKEHIKGYFTINFFEDGAPGELFIEVDKEGAELHGWADCWAIAISMLFQYGVDPKLIVAKFKHQNFEPNGFTNLPEARICKSIIDLVMKYLDQRFLQETKIEDDYDSMVEALSAE